MEIEGLTDDELDAVLIRLGNDVYAATHQIETHERKGRAFGNGHHARQNVAKFAQRELLLSWRDKAQAARVGQRRGISLDSEGV